MRLDFAKWVLVLREMEWSTKQEKLYGVFEQAEIHVATSVLGSRDRVFSGFW
jgi:hypothetical protein